MIRIRIQDNGKRRSEAEKIRPVFARLRDKIIFSACAEISVIEVKPADVRRTGPRTGVKHMCAHCRRRRLAVTARDPDDAVILFRNERKQFGAAQDAQPAPPRRAQLCVFLTHGGRKYDRLRVAEVFGRVPVKDADSPVFKLRRKLVRRQIAARHDTAALRKACRQSAHAHASDPDKVDFMTR